MASRAGKVAGLVAGTVARGIWLSTMVLTPLFGFWLASSLAAYNNATQWLALLVGLMLFPILPVGWDLLFVWRRSRKENAKPAILTRVDRLVLRTLIINGLFLGGMMWQARDASFRALAVRGDWMLDGHHGPIASTMRGWMLGFADRFDRRQVQPSEYGDSDTAPTEVPVPDEPEPTPQPDGTVTPPVKDPLAWPIAATPHPLVASIPESEQASIETVGAYLASRIPDKRELTKALHDFIVARLTYDDAALKLIEARDYKNTPSQKAEDVFAARTGVCEGYSRLFVALGKAAGVEVAYLVGHVRNRDHRHTISDDPWDTSAQEALEGVGHAWNAVKLDDRWYLIDATWNDGNDEYRTTYLFPPPRAMALDHFPEDTKWQLLPEPLSLGDFVRQPMMTPTSTEYGLTLISPTRSQVTVDGELTILVDNPYGAAMAARAMRDGEAKSSEGTRCKVTEGTQTKIVCPFGDGEYEVALFAAPKERTTSGRYSLDHVGSILVNSH